MRAESLFLLLTSEERSDRTSQESRASVLHAKSETPLICGVGEIVLENNVHVRCQPHA